MPDEQDIPKQSPDDEANTDAILGDSSISPLQSLTSDMEVHHHPDLHHKKKRFREYFLEFLMIFLAVTMGFFAETIRESFSENAKAKELAESLYKEAYSDSIDIQKRLMVRDRKEKEIDFFIAYVKDSSLTNLSDRFYRSFTWSFFILSTIQFEPADGMLNQLRNSGSLRYFKSNELQREIGELSVAIAKVRSRMELENGINAQELGPFVLKFYDFNWYSELTQHGNLNLVDALNKQPAPKYRGVILNVKDFKRLEAENIVSYYRLVLKATKTLQLNNYIEINHKLLETLRSEYKIK
ncbi:MAG TPA: hypothetical protein VGQ53_11390 [Chitinophagaceae bacterium]|jgi:hypothetical protein|nr:hypothetical protein [Chitinophagaceae bacterium]